MRKLRTRGRVLAGGFALAVALGLSPLAASPAQAQSIPIICSAHPVGTSAWGYCSNPHPEVYFEVVVHCSGQWGTFPRYSGIRSSYATVWVHCGSGEQATWAFTRTLHIPPPPPPPPSPPPNPTPPPPEPPWQPPCPDCNIP